jgi:hypothetical protein
VHCEGMLSVMSGLKGFEELWLAVLRGGKECDGTPIGYLWAVLRAEESDGSIGS